MRAQWLPMGLIVSLTALAAAGLAQPGTEALDPVAEGVQTSVPPPSGASTSGTAPSLPGGPSPTPPAAGPAEPGLGEPPGVDLGEALQPDFDAGLWFSIGVGAGLLALALSAWLGTRFVTSENVLENDARRAIFEYIKTNPGCHLRETASALQLSTTNVLWHLRKLEESNLVAGKKLEGYKVFYPVEGGVEAKRMGLALAVLRNPNARQILGIIARNPGVHQREIARNLLVNHGTVRWHLKKLGIVQLVLEVKKGAVSMYYVSALGLQALERVEARPAEVAQPPPLAEPVQPAQAEA